MLGALLLGIINDGFNLVGVNAYAFDVVIGIAVARSVHADARLLLLDEPLAAMGAREGAQILRLLDRLKERGDLAVILIAHNYGQVVDVCDRVNLLQHGEITFDRRSADTSVAELLELVHAEYRVGPR